MKKILLIIGLLIFFSALAIYAAIQMRGQATTQEKGTENENIGPVEIFITATKGDTVLTYDRNMNLVATLMRANITANTYDSLVGLQKDYHPHYQIVRDTVYIDRSRPINKPWYSYEIETTGDPKDSIYLYSGRELIKALSREQATVFAIDSLIVLDNL